ncbi:MAG: carboxypeptidase regulatory-like domain-containing protein, partial [Acidobacteriaceae bacterium]|nr:carboxypeptidase regulatory-like domain-containing protein [Acidobacteriaceae bacterium]
MRGHTLRRIHIVFLVALTSLTSNLSKAQDFQGGLAGLVRDSSGALVSEATATVQLLGADLKRETRTNSNGEFRFNALPPGDYAITVNAKGFGQANATVPVQVRSVQSITVTLIPATLTQTVNVTAGA